jgi:hypothetical protein
MTYNDDRFVDPFDLPEEFKMSFRKKNKKKDQPIKSIDLYDLELHDDYDWLAQPCVEVTPKKEWDGRWDES